MPDHTKIYRSEAEKYDLLISKQPDLLETLQSICPLEGKDIIDLGAGTGRLTLPIARVARSVLALDASADMLRVAANKLTGANLHNWDTRVSDNRKIKAENDSADVIVSGWSICYVANSHEKDWEIHLEEVMEELGRVLRPGGTTIILETMGTGVETPSPPDFLVDYYSALEKKYGFQSTWIRMDYRFDHLDEARELTEFFFGAELSGKVVRENWVTLPECAGIWWRS